MTMSIYLWRASLLALGREAALIQTPCFFRKIAVPGFGAAPQPNASKLARHNEPVGSEYCVQGGNCL